ncbi:MAG: glycerophosphodiester phosphodiesterase [Clostridium sp.]
MINFAHRGASGYYPENTILAIKEGIKCGATGLEIDVHKTKDGEIVVIHDEDVKRTFHGNGLIRNYTLSELKSLENKNPRFNDFECNIPTLEEVILLIKDREILLNIELKTDEIHYEGIEDDVIKIIKRHGIEERVILSSFNHESIKISKEIYRNIKTGALYHYEIENVIEYAKELGADAIHPSGTLVTKELIEEAHKNNLMVNIYTVNEIKDMKTLLDLNVDGVFTDYPDRLKSILT